LYIVGDLTDLLCLSPTFKINSQEGKATIYKKKGHPQLYISVLNTKTSWGGAMEKSKNII
jgi:hypothetical protein